MYSIILVTLKVVINTKISSISFEQFTVSKDRESNESGSGMRFRNHSPSTTKRRSRDREPRSTSEKTHWERDADANTMLITNESSPAIGTNATNTMTTSGTGEAADTHLLDDSTGNPFFKNIIRLCRRNPFRHDK